MLVVCPPVLDKFHFNDFNATGLEVKKVAARISTHHFERKKREEEEENEKKKDSPNRPFRVFQNIFFLLGSRSNS